MTGLFAGVARADLITLAKHIDADTGNSVEVVVDDDDGTLIMFWDMPGSGASGQVVLGNIAGDPNPEGGSTPTFSADDVDEFLESLMVDGGGYLLEVDPWSNPLGYDLMDDGKGPSVIDPWEMGGYAVDGEGGGNGGIGLDSGGIGEFINKMKNQGSSDEDDDDEDDDRGLPGSEPDFGGAPLNPELVNPVPGYFRK